MRNSHLYSFKKGVMAPQWLVGFGGGTGSAVWLICL